MNILKRIAAALIVLSLCAAPLSAFGAANFDDDGNRTEEERPDDAVDNRPKHELDNPDDAYTEDLEYKEYIRLKTEYNETVNKLSALEIWYGTSGGEHTDKITAGDFAKTVCGLMDMNGLGYDEIRSLGYDGGTLKNASGSVKFISAVRVIVNALGYGIFAEQSGGDDGAYLSVWRQYKLSAQNFEPDMELTMLDAAHIIDDALEAEVYKKNYLSGNAVWEKSGKKALEYFKDINYVKGTVRSADEYSLDKNKTENHVSIDGRLFWTDKADEYLDKLGCKVSAYYRLDDEELLYLSVLPQNNILTVEGTDIFDASDTRIYYNNGEKDKSISVSDKATEVLNYMSAKRFDKSDLEKCDSITAIDNNGDGRYEVLFVFKYDIMVTDRVSAEENKIYGLYNDIENYTLDVNFTSPDTKLFDRNMNPVDSSYIISNSVLSVAKSEEKTRIIVSNLAYSAKVTTVESGGEGTIFCGDRQYSYSTNEDYCRPKVKAGKKYTFYLDYKRRIAGLREETADEIKYGYLIYAYDANSDGEDCVRLRMLPYVGEAEDFKTAKKTIIDGVSFKGTVSAVNALRESAQKCSEEKQNTDADYKPHDIDSGSVVYVREPILYKTDNDGLIKYIDTPYTSPNEYADKETNLFKRKTMTYYPDFSKKASGQKAGGTFLRNLMAFSNNNGSVTAVNNDTKVFVVPVTNDTGRVRNINNYTKSNLAYFKDWRSYPETGEQYTELNRIDAYNLNEERVAGIIVYSKSIDAAETIDKTVPLTVVSGIGKALDSNGMEVTRIWGYQGNSEVYADLAEDVYLTKSYNGPDGSRIMSTVKKGDIIRYSVNSRGEIADYVKVFSLRDEDDPDYVKQGNEYGNGADPLTLNKTLIAVSDGRYAQNGHNTAHIYDSSGNYNFGAGYRVVYGTLAYKNGTNLVLRTLVDTAYGQLQSTEITDFTEFNVLCIDEAGDKVYVPTADELLSERGAGNDASKIIMHTEGGKQRQLIIVKRKK